MSSYISAQAKDI